MATPLTNRRAEGILVLVALLWGATFVIVKGGLRHATPLLFLAVRFLMAAAALSVPIALERRRISGKTVAHGALLGLFLFVGFAGQTVGLRFTTVARSSFITYMLALFVPPLQLVLSRKRLSAVNLGGLAVVILGIFVLTSPGGVGLNIGDGLTLICAFGFAVHIVLLDRISGDHDPVALTLVQFAVTAVLAALGSIALEDPSLTPRVELWLALGYLSLFGSALAVYLQIRFQRHTSPTRAVIIYSLEPVFSVLLAWSLLRERLGWEELLGGGLILAGVALSEVWGTVRLEERAGRR